MYVYGRGKVWKDFFLLIQEYSRGVCKSRCCLTACMPAYSCFLILSLESFYLLMKPKPNTFIQYPVAFEGKTQISILLVRAKTRSQKFHTCTFHLDCDLQIFMHH